jgi:hypothetical protein
MTDNEKKLKKILENPELFIESFIKIVDKKGKLVPFKLNPQQKELIDGIVEDKYSICLKSRQLGITSLSLALSLYYAVTKPNTTCLLVSYSMDSANGIFEKLKQMFYDMPPAIKPKLINNNRRELKFINNSRIIISSIGNKDVARGLTLKFVHVSEVAFCKETIEKQLLSIEQALMPNGKIILESTANGMNYFSELYGNAQKQQNMYKDYFFSWVDDKLMFKDEYEMFSQRYIKNNGKLPTVEELSETEKQLHDSGASIKQIVWRRLKISNSSPEQFAQEFPTNPIEAFVSTGSNIFDPALIHKQIKSVLNRKTLPKPKLLPNTISRFYGRDFLMWEEPKKGTRYYFGVDVSEGIGRDSSVIEILDEDGRQVAEFATNKIKPYEFAGVIHELAIYFNYAYLVIEKASAGHTVIDKLRHEYKYKNMHKHKEYDSRGRAKKKVGWVTNGKTKSMMIADFVELWETNQIYIHSKDLLGEMKLFIAKDNGKIEAQGKTNHDDRVMAFAMALQGIKSNVWYK